MSIILIHPPWNRFPSGGNRYNENILKQAERNGFPLFSMPLKGDRWEKDIPRLKAQCDLIIWDSFFLEALCRHPSSTGQAAFLAHYLPSLNPTLSTAQRRSIRGKEARALEGMQFLITTGRPVEQTLKARYPEKPLFLCEPGVDAIFFPRAKRPLKSRRAIQLLTAANLLPGKGQLEMLSILSRLPAQNWHWHLAGHDGQDRAYAGRLWESAAKLNLQEKMTFHGILSPSELAHLMEKIDIFTFPSHYEAYGMALAEAAAQGLPVVTTRVGAADRLIQHGRTGFLAPVGAWEQFGDYLNRLITDSELRDRFHAQGRRPRTWEMAFDDFRAACQHMLEQILRR